MSFQYLQRASMDKSIRTVDARALAIIRPVTLTRASLTATAPSSIRSCCLTVTVAPVLNANQVKALVYFTVNAVSAVALTLGLAKHGA